MTACLAFAKVGNPNKKTVALEQIYSHSNGEKLNLGFSFLDSTLWILGKIVRANLCVRPKILFERSEFILCRIFGIFCRKEIHTVLIFASFHQGKEDLEVIKGVNK